MAKRMMEMSIALALLAMMFGPNFTSAQSTSCTVAIVSLAPCVGYMSGNPLASTPPVPCCSQLSSVVSNQAQCLCTLITGGGSSFGLSINLTQAVSLPAACGLKAPPASICNVGGQASSPSQSPPSMTKPSSTPTKPATPAGSGSKTTPSTTTTTHSSNGNSYKSTSSIMFSVLLHCCICLSLAVF